MACQFDDLPIGTKVNLNFINMIRCEECGGEYYDPIPRPAIYVGMEDYFHLFNFDYKRRCKLCGIRIHACYCPCEDAYYFDMSTITIGQHNKQEDY